MSRKGFEDSWEKGIDKGKAIVYHYSSMTDIKIELHEALSKRYSLRKPMPNASSVQATIPFEVVEREARKAGLSVDNFIQQYDAEYLYNHFGGAYLRFVRKQSSNKE